MSSTPHPEGNIIEPRLKYNRVPNYAKEIVSKDTISCIAVHSKFIVIGTEWGNIHVLDHLGNQSSKIEINAHSTTINQISIDNTGEFIASCSNDGKVMIFSLLDDRTYPLLSFNQEIKAIAISPDFKRTSQFVTGDRRLLLVSKGILSTHKHKVLQENRTVIRNIKWNGNIVVYATDDSVFVFDMKEQKLIGIIDPDKSNLVSNNVEFYCRIFWANDQMFLVGWGHLVQMCIIKDNPLYTMQMKSLEFTGVTKSISSKKVENVYSFSIPDLILGLVTYDKYVLAVIDPVVISNLSELESVSRPQPLVAILEPSNLVPGGYTELTYEQIPLKDYQNSKYHKIHLDKIPDENEFYFVSSKDLINAKEREIDDRIQWLIQQKAFVRALDLVQITKETSPSQTKYNYKDIGLLYINHLLSNKEPNNAANMCKSILDDKASWETMVITFLDYNCIEWLLPHIPYADDLKLSQQNYMLILENQLNHSLPSFLKLLQKWPPSLYVTKDVIKLIFKNQDNERLVYRQPNEKLTKVMQNREVIILECLGILYEHNQEYEKSLDLYFRLKNDYAFKLITKRKMFEYVKTKLVNLFNYDKEKTLAMLMEYINDISPETIVKILSPTPIWLFNYLHTLVNHNVLASEPYHLQMVTLYAEFKKESLLSFLKSSDKYDLNAAIELCERKNFNKELIYLLGRIGQSKKALQMIMTQENSVNEAIDYCLERADDDLWQQLMAFSIDKPVYIKAILENSGMDIDLKMFIRKILTGIEIPDLKNSLVTLLINNEKRNGLITAHQIGKWNDLFQMIKNRFKHSIKPIICDFSDGRNKQCCIICSKSIVNYLNEFIVFPCSHLLHESCFKPVLDQSKLFCHLCKES